MTAEALTDAAHEPLDYGHPLEFGYFLTPGAGGYLDAARAMGSPALTPRQGLEALEEAIAIVRAMWSGERRGLRFQGRYYHLEGVHPGPLPAHAIQVWVGASRPRALALTGRLADGWVSPLMSYKPPGEAARANRANDRAAREAGREPGEIRRIYNLQDAFTGTARGPAGQRAASPLTVVGQGRAE
jgi:alkanesulfonate monooxygenase SsuD/methylene tetrahydromethanopterin reductase-like flavin-dependent oxidoreductase (luciferase family)